MIQMPLESPLSGKNFTASQAGLTNGSFRAGVSICMDPGGMTRAGRQRGKGPLANETRLMTLSDRHLLLALMLSIRQKGPTSMRFCMQIHDFE